MTRPPKFVLKANGLSTTRQWKSRKRGELRAVMRALDDYNRGCAYTPSYELVDTAKSVLNQIALSLSVKNWGK